MCINNCLQSVIKLFQKTLCFVRSTFYIIIFFDRDITSLQNYRQLYLMIVETNTICKILKYELGHYTLILQA